MNRKLNSLLAIAMVALMFTVSSCSDDDDEGPARSTLISANTWIFSTVEINAKGLSSEDRKQFEQSFKEEYAGSELVFKADKTFTETFDGYSSTGTWEFSNGEKKIVMKYEGESDEDAYEQEIETLTSDKLNLKTSGPEGSLIIKYIKK